MIAILLSISLTTIGVSVDEQPKITVEPKTTYGHPSDVFSVDINIQYGEDVFAWGFRLSFVPLGKVLTPLGWEEGNFLPAGGETFFSASYDILTGSILFGDTLLGPLPGVSGDGTLVTVTFQVMEAGETALELSDAKLYDSTGSLIKHHALSGFYAGPTIDLIQKRLSTHAPHVGETLYLSAKVRNDGDVPLYGKARFEIFGEGGEYFNLMTGDKNQKPASYDGWMQWMYPTVDGDFTGLPEECLLEAEGMVSETDYTPVSGTYIEEYDGYGPIPMGGGVYLWYNLADLGYWQFEDIVVPEGYEIVGAFHEVYAWSDRDLPSDMVDMYLWNGEAEVLVWSMGYGSHLYAGVPAWYSNDVTFLYDTEEKVNAAEIWMEYFPYTSPSIEGSDPPIPSPQGMNHYGYAYFTIGPAELSHEWQKENVWEAIYIDAMRLRVEILPSIPAGAEFELEPVEFYCEEPGMFYGVCTAWFGYYKPLGGGAAPTFNVGKKTATFKFEVRP